MKPAFDLAGSDVNKDFRSLVELLNRESFRTRHIITRLHDAVPRTYDEAYFGATTLTATTLGYDAWREAGRCNCTAGGTVAYAKDRLVAIPFLMNAPFRIDSVQFNVTTGGAAGSKARCGIYDSVDDRNGRPYPGALLADGGEFDSTATGVKLTSVSIDCEPGHLYWFAYACGTAAPTVRSVPLAALKPTVGADAAMAGTPYWGVYVSLTYAALPKAFPLDTTLLGETGANAPALSFHQAVNPTRSKTTYLNVYSPFEDGEVLRAARLVPAEDYGLSRRGASIKVALGLRSHGTYEVLGTEWDSTQRGLTVGTPFDLVATDTRIPVDTCLAVRVVQRGWPSPSLASAAVQTSLGYEGA